MGYSTNIKTLIPMLPYLQDIMRGEEFIAWDVRPGEAKRWAYRIREAFSLASLHPDHSPLLTAQIGQYEIKEVSPTRVEARRRTTPLVVAVPIPASPPSANKVSILHGAQRNPPIPGPQSASSIVGALTGQTVIQPIHYSEAALSPEELAKLERWASAQEPKLMILVSGESVTVAPYDPEVLS